MQRLTPVLLTGSADLDALAGALDELHEATGAPMTARRPWLTIWAETHRAYLPWGVALEGPGTTLHGAALLARRRTALGATEIVALGHGMSDYTRLPARSAAAAGALATALADILHTAPRPWKLDLRQLPVDDPVAEALRRRLAHVVTTGDHGAPTIRFRARRELSDHLSRNSRQKHRQMLRRIEKAGLSPAFDHLRDVESVAASLADVERVARARDEALGRRSQFDSPHQATFIRTVMVELARRDEAELTTLRLDGRLAAYTFALLDGPAYRIWHNRFDPDTKAFSTGWLANIAAFERALGDERFTELDWMMGEEDYKLRTANDVVATQRLVARSSPVGRHLASTSRLLAHTVRRFPVVARAAERGRAALRGSRGV